MCLFACLSVCLLFGCLIVRLFVSAHSCVSVCKYASNVCLLLCLCVYVRV